MSRIIFNLISIRNHCGVLLFLLLRHLQMPHPWLWRLRSHHWKLRLPQKVTNKLRYCTSTAYKDTHQAHSATQYHTVLHSTRERPPVWAAGRSRKGNSWHSFILCSVQTGVLDLICFWLFSWAAFVVKKKKKKKLKNSSPCFVPFLMNAITQHMVCQPSVINSILCVFSLSGCPRAKKSGIKTPTKDNQEDSELLKFVLLRTPVMSRGSWARLTVNLA